MNRSAPGAGDKAVAQELEPLLLSLAEVTAFLALPRLRHDAPPFLTCLPRLLEDPGRSSAERSARRRAATAGSHAGERSDPRSDGVPAYHGKAVAAQRRLAEPATAFLVGFFVRRQGQDGDSTASLANDEHDARTDFGVDLSWACAIMESKMPIIDALNELQKGRVLRGTIELPDYLISWRMKFDGARRITIDLDELGLDDPIPFELTEKGHADLDEAPPGDFPSG